MLARVSCWRREGNDEACCQEEKPFQHCGEGEDEKLGFVPIGATGGQYEVLLKTMSIPFWPSHP
jgi:hypothetical protein